MRSSIPTGRTYLGFVLLWNAAFCVAGLMCFVLLAAGYIIPAIFALLLTAYGFVRHAKSIGRRAKQGIRRPTPEFRRWLLAASESRDASDGGYR
jgi:hypothetical protein